MMTALDEARIIAERLSAEDKLHLINELVQQLLHESKRAAPLNSRPSLWGALAHLGPAPSAKDIENAQRDMWENFPREDI